MGVKKIARPINKAKNEFVKWLKRNKAEDISVFEGEKWPEWDYYRMVDAFINEKIYLVYFMMMNGNVKIDYSDEENSYKAISIDEFMQLIN